MKSRKPKNFKNTPQTICCFPKFLNILIVNLKCIPKKLSKETHLLLPCPQPKSKAIKEKRQK